MIWALCVWATFLSPRPECISFWPDQQRCNAVGEDWLRRMLVYRNAQHIQDNITFGCVRKPAGETP